jgi:cellulose synthase/poly-beta-1,6-N-acetylglucosamine synthase-like glycosyltransferase
MIYLAIIFWLCAACVVYTFLLYPLLLAMRPRFRALPPALARPTPRSLSIILAAHNEEKGVDRRLDELTNLLAASGLDGEIIVVSDGSTDMTANAARAYEDRGVRVLELEKKRGKAFALTQGCALARCEILVFADVRQTWAPDALEQLLKNFADPTVGGVSGDLCVESAPGVMSGVALYWRYEKWLRKQESQVYSMIGATGAISAVRRELFQPIPAGTLLDDVYWPLQVCLQGYRVVHEAHAVAFDRLPDKPRDEFRRKVRTLTGNFQLAALVPAALLPWRNPIWLQFMSHKLLRLVVPWALLGLLLASAALPHWWYQAAFSCQVACYVLALLGLIPAIKPFRPASAAASFLVLNSASWVAFWVWISGRAEGSWGKVAYDNPKKEYAPDPVSVSS